MSDEEFEAIQKDHYGKKQGAEAQGRAAKSLQSCLEATHAFKVIGGLRPITIATADDCAAFPRKALKLPKTTLHPYPNSKEGAVSYSANTVLKWSVALQAAWERASRAGGKKCIRGVVDERKLLADNPWKQFPWIEGTTDLSASSTATSCSPCWTTWGRSGPASRFLACSRRCCCGPAPAVRRSQG